MVSNNGKLTGKWIMGVSRVRISSYLDMSKVKRDAVATDCVRANSLNHKCKILCCFM